MMSCRNEGGPSRQPNGSERKRGRDRSTSAGSSRESKKAFVPSNAGKGRKDKKREEFFDQPVTKPQNKFDKHRVSENSTPIKCVANYFKISIPDTFVVTDYRVDFNPEVNDSRLKSFLLFQHKQRLGVFVFDMEHQIYLHRTLPDETTILMSTDRNGHQYEIKLRKTRSISFNQKEFLQVTNLIKSHAMRCLDLQLMRRNYFDPAAMVSIKEYRLNIMPGYDTSIRKHEHDLLLNCDTVSKVIRDQNVYEILGECQRQGGDWKSVFEKRICGSTVVTKYNKCASYLISAVDWDKNPGQTFETKNGPITFASYYQTRYKQTVRDLQQPLLVSKAKARNIRAGEAEFILLIPELCHLTGITDRERSDFRLMKAMSEKTLQTPRQRVETLKAFNRRINDNPQSVQVFQQNSMRLDRQLVSFEAFQLPSEKILFGNNRSVQVRDGDWKRELQNQKLYNSVLQEELRNWFFIYPRQCAGPANEFLRLFNQAAQGLMPRGEVLQQPTLVELSNDSVRGFADEIQKLKQRRDPKFMMIFLRNSRSDVYSAIKKITLTGQVIPTQVIVEKRNNRTALSIATNVAIQVNCKLGGIPWALDLKIDGMMVVGFDTSADPSDKRKTYGAMVASLNPKNEGGKFFGLVQRHEHGAVLSESLGTMFLGAFNKYIDHNKAAPKQILIYRDGVGDGQIQYVIESELADIKHKLKRFYPDKEPPIGFVLMNKRTNTRVMKVDQREGYTNPPAGTVINDVITLNERYDFYLVSQSVRQGTVSPTYYNVIHDNFFYKNRPDDMQKLTNKFCHLYVNWSGTTKIPHVVQYAKKLAALSTLSLGDSQCGQFDDKHALYFL